MKFEQVSITLSLIAVCALVFIIQQILPITDALSFTPSQAFYMPWTFVTAIFLHASVTHILFNMIALFFFGIYLERKISKKNYLLIFFIAGIVGNIGYILTAPTPDTPGLGASGAIYGIMATLAVLEPTSIVFIYGIPVPMFMAAIFWFVSEYFGLFTPSDVANGAHLAGLFVGVAAGFYFRYKLRKNAFIFNRTY